MKIKKVFSDNQSDLFRNLPFVGVSCYEGTTCWMHDLDFILENPLSGLYPYPCFTSVLNGGKAPDFTEHLILGLDFLRIAGIKMNCINFTKFFSILNSLTNIFVDPKIQHFKAFRILENALKIK